MEESNQKKRGAVWFEKVETGMSGKPPLKWYLSKVKPRSERIVI